MCKITSVTAISLFDHQLKSTARGFGSRRGALDVEQSFEGSARDQQPVCERGPQSRPLEQRLQLREEQPRARAPLLLEQLRWRLLRLLRLLLLLPPPQEFARTCKALGEWRVVLELVLLLLLELSAREAHLPAAFERSVHTGGAERSGNS